MNDAPGERPSRIYAGCEPSAPVDPLVPFALVVPFVAVWKVRGFMVAHAYERFGSGPGVEVLDRAVLWLIAGMTICALVLPRKFVRGRGEWGAYPLGFGIVGCAWAWLHVTWFGFDEQGILPVIRQDTYFGGLLALAVLTLCLTYGVFSVLIRARATRPALRWIVLVGPVVSAVVVLAARSAVDRGSGAESDNSLRIGCRPPMFPERYSYDRPSPRGWGDHYYTEHDGGLLVLPTPVLGENSLLIDEFVEVECGRESIERARATEYEEGARYYPRAHVALDADSEAW